MSVFDTIQKAAKIQALKAIAFVCLNDMVLNVRRRLRAERNGEDPRTEEDQRQHTKDIGYEPRMSQVELATLYCAISDELDTIGSDKFDRLEPVADVLERMAGRPFKPDTPANRKKLDELKAAYKMTEDEAVRKLTRRQQGFNEFFQDQIPDVQVELDRDFEQARDVSYEDAFAALAAVHQVRLFDVAIKGCEREAKRCRKLDADYDWDDMLERAVDLESEAETLAAARKPLLAKAQLVE